METIYETQEKQEENLSKLADNGNTKETEWTGEP